MQAIEKSQGSYYQSKVIIQNNQPHHQPNSPIIQQSISANKMFRLFAIATSLLAVANAFAPSLPAYKTSAVSSCYFCK
jgi:hypothetical protein